MATPLQEMMVKLEELLPPILGTIFEPLEQTLARSRPRILLWLHCWRCF
jgi:hypothetical protein